MPSETLTMRSCSPSRYSVSTVSSVRHTIRRGGNWRMDHDMQNIGLNVTTAITTDVIAGLDRHVIVKNVLTKINRHSGARGARTSDVQFAHRGISRFRVWSFGPSRNDERGNYRS